MRSAKGMTGAFCCNIGQFQQARTQFYIKRWLCVPHPLTTQRWLQDAVIATGNPRGAEQGGCRR